MKKAIITVGMGFGDEGKGATVDALVREYQSELVVRYSGGAQAGHNVEVPGGVRHTFAQFGAGTFAGAKTYLGPRMIVSPASLVPEARHLQSLGIEQPFRKLFVHPECLITTRYHATMNRLRERARGKSKHGSCGLGIGEARHYWLRFGDAAIRARDIRDRKVIMSKLSLMRDRFLLDMQELKTLDPHLVETLRSWTPRDEAESLMESSQELQISETPPACETAIFEGAQGVLLDEWYGFHPFTTWSTVTSYHARELVEEYEVSGVITLGITRAYSSRHGAGPFPTYCPRMTANITDPGNPKNDWQDSIRFGPLDMRLLEYSNRVCPVDGIVVTCLDQLDSGSSICTGYGNRLPLELPRSLSEQTELGVALQSAEPILEGADSDAILERVSMLAPVVMTSRGPTFFDREFTSHWPQHGLVQNATVVS